MLKSIEGELVESINFDIIDDDFLKEMKLDFDVQKYLQDRKRRAQEILKNRSKDVQVDTGFSSATQDKSRPYGSVDKNREAKFN